MKFETLANHTGRESDPGSGAVTKPVCLTSTYKQDGVGKPHQRYECSHAKNPTRIAFENCLAALEGSSF